MTDDPAAYVVTIALAGYDLKPGDRVTVSLLVTTNDDGQRHGAERHTGTVVHATRSVLILRAWDAAGGVRVRIPWDAIAAITDAPETTPHPGLT